ncbi:ABC transporter substrate-binding protein [Gordonia sp. DT30]|uniref:ABC transporter substrate-binding protein n=1 Tax=Gordonia sp. DT30 TaxID=3416546 RepID=UPI003CF76978
MQGGGQSRTKHGSGDGFSGRFTTPGRRRGRRAVVLGAAALCTAALTFSACSGDKPLLTTPDGKTISTSTTRIAEVNVVSPDRDYATTCLAPTAATDPRADVGRIVVTDPALLDDLCALGLGPKVTAVTSAPGSVPAYLGPQLSSVPAIGTTPDASAARTAAPDIVLTTPATAGSAQAFGGIKTVDVGTDDTWQKRFQAVADALGRSSEGTRLLTEFTDEATKTGKRMDAPHNQVSLVRFTKDSEVIAGTGTFAGQILQTIGVARPATQRGADSVTVTDKNFTDADGDLIYVSFEGDGGLAHGKEVLLSDRWLDMGAPTWKRVLSVDDEIWYGGSGLAAAWLVLNDVKGSLNSNS